MLYKSIFDEKSTLTFRAERQDGRSKMTSDHEINVKVFYGKERELYSNYLVHREVCTLPASREALAKLATDLWELGVYPEQAIRAAEREQANATQAESILAAAK